MPDATPSAADVLTVAMAEFKALRDEINQRATYCHTILNINVVATGTVAGLVLGNTSRLDLLLILPILGPVLGLLWLDHSYAIRGMGDYINDRLRPQVCDAAGDQSLLGWEGYLDDFERRHKLLRFLPLGVPIVVLFAAIPTFALLRVVDVIGVDWRGAIWLVGLLLTVSYLTLLLLLLFAPYLRTRRRATRGPEEAGAQPPPTID